MNKDKQIEEMRKEVASIHRFFLEDDDYDSLDDYIADMLFKKGYRKQSEWISVDERLPDNDTERVLVFLMDDDFTKPIGDNKIDTDRYVDGKWVRWGRFVTHWMPLPEPPKMKGGYGK